MDINIGVIISLFLIIYFAVRLAINPLVNYQVKTSTDDSDNLRLINLRDIGVFSPTEFEDIAKLYQDRNILKKDFERYEKSIKVINELKEINYFTDEEYKIKVDKLKKHFKID